MNFSATIKEARKNKGLSQMQLAAMLSAKGKTVTAQQVSCWEKGKYKPSKNNLINIYEVLKIPFGEMRRESNAIGIPADRGGGQTGLQSYIREHGTKEEILELDFAESECQSKALAIAEAIRGRLNAMKKASA